MTGNFDRPLTERMHPDGSVVSLRAYELAEGYQAIRKVLRTGMTPMAVIEEVTEANLRGRGGAGFQTGVKWSFVPRGKDVPNPTYLVVNGDEMEPGTFKDRFLMEQDPHQLIEGAMVAAFAIEADIAYIFCAGNTLWPVSALHTPLLKPTNGTISEKTYSVQVTVWSSISMSAAAATSAGRRPDS